MPFTYWVNELPQEGSGDDSLAYQYSKRFLVRCSTKRVTVPEILALPEIPAIFSSYGITHLGAICTRRNPVQQSDNPFNWIVDCEFRTIGRSVSGTLGSGGGFGGQDHLAPADRREDPLQRPAEMRLTHQEYTEAVVEDFNGKKIRNSARDMYIPALERERHRPMIILTKNQPDEYATFALLVAYHDVVNSDTFIGFERGSWKVRIEAERQYENDVYFYRCTYELVFNFDGWNPTRVLDMGFNKYENGKKVELINPKTNQPYNEPQPLNGAGLLLPETDAYVYNEFVFYEELPFAALNIP